MLTPEQVFSVIDQSRLGCGKTNTSFRVCFEKSYDARKRTFAYQVIIASYEGDIRTRITTINGGSMDEALQKTASFFVTQANKFWN